MAELVLVLGSAADMVLDAERELRTPAQARNRKGPPDVIGVRTASNPAGALRAAPAGSSGARQTALAIAAAARGMAQRAIKRGRIRLQVWALSSVYYTARHLALLWLGKAQYQSAQRTDVHHACLDKIRRAPSRPAAHSRTYPTFHGSKRDVFVFGPSDKLK